MNIRSIKIVAFLTFIFFSFIIIQGCSDDPDGSPETLNLPSLTFENPTITEDDTDISVSLDLNIASGNKTNAVVNFAVISGSAISGLDFKVLTEGKLIFSPEDTKKTINLTLFGDEVKEIKKSFTIKFYNPVNMTIPNDLMTVTILDDDDETAGLKIPTSGYSTPLNYDGYNLTWADEFDGAVLNPNNWVFETGAGGWGNNELQYYRQENLSMVDGHMVITAKKQKFGSSEYTSSRIKTQGKKSFKFGRIDIRAALPKGQGVWPAFWMLGTNITTVNWPACGEIDIMELTGDLPNRVLSTVHFGPDFAGRQQKGNSLYLTGNKNFQDEFHVFTLIWKEDLLEFYVDDEKFYTITPASLGNNAYPFNKNFFFIMNIAIGGNLPGNPDATTPLPQNMIVDYIRVFQPK